MAEQPRYEGTMHHCLQQKETSQGTKKDSSNYNHAKHSLRPASITNLTCSKKTKKIQPPLNFNKITLNDLLTTTDVHPLYTPLYLFVSCNFFENFVLQQVISTCTNSHLLKLLSPTISQTKGVDIEYIHVF